MKYYKVTFAPHDTLSYTYDEQADDADKAAALAEERFKFDIGYDRAKDFGIISVELEELEE